MDCRSAFSLATLFLASLAGCEPNSKLFSIWPSSNPSAPDARVAEQAAAQPVLPAVDKPGWEKDVKLKPETLVALAAFREAHSLEPNITPDQKQQLLEDARVAYLRALELDPNHVPAHLGLARFYDTAGNHPKAAEEYAKLSKIRPRDAWLRFEIGMFHARAKEWPPALEQLRNASDLDPENAHLARTYGICLARAGRYDESVSWLLEKKQLSEADAHCMVAKMLHHLQQDDASRQHLRLALQAEPNSRAAHELLNELDGRAFTPLVNSADATGPQQGPAPPQGPTTPQ